MNSHHRRAPVFRIRWLPCVLILLACSFRADGADAPKSTHTYLRGLNPDIYSFDVDMRIREFPADAEPGFLYFPAIQVDFEEHKEWAHGGVQWTRGKKANWGGGSTTGYGKTFDGEKMSIVVPFDWVEGRWYRYRVWRLDPDETGYHRWLFTILDYETGVETRVGSVRTVSKYIKGAMVWTETGYGVVCDTNSIVVEWRNPAYRTAAGEFGPKSGIVNYNGTCSDPHNTNQEVTGSDPLSWIQTTNSPRTIEAGQELWRH